MKKLAVLLVVLGVLGALAKRIAPKMQNVDWERKIEAMPENAPPKWIFRNITAIRENTDRIIELLEHRKSQE